jgi:hypothetical protein
MVIDGLGEGRPEREGNHMEYRDLGRTGLRVSEIGFGAWAIGGDAWGPVEDADSLAAMERAMELGIFETPILAALPEVPTPDRFVAPSLELS